MTLEKHILSKSTYMMGVQCDKRLYLHKYQPELKNELSDSQKALFAKGTETGIVAQKLFPNGEDATPIDTFSYQKSVLQTQQFIEEGKKVIYEACFQYDGILCAVDILEKKGSKWYAYEVKSSTEVKDYHIQDAAIQYYVITNSGTALADISIVYLNNKYVKKGKLDIQQLFAMESVKKNILPLQQDIPNKVADLKKVLKLKSAPDIKVNLHCFSPFECDFSGVCWKGKSENNSVLVLYKSDRQKLLDEEIYSFNDIPEGYKLTNSSKNKIDKLNNGQHKLELEPIKAFLKQFKYPFYYFDFETYQMAIPEFDITRPYQMIPFQYSLHTKKNKDAITIHTEYLGNGKTDPRQELIKKMLKELGKKGSIICYNESFEKTRIKEMANDFPEFKEELLALNERVIDLMKPFQKGWLYHPDFKASYSIKYVLPALIPKFSYSKLEIQNGGVASETYGNMKNLSDKEKIKVRKNLIEYCKLDTLAMVKIHEYLIDKI